MVKKVSWEKLFLGIIIFVGLLKLIDLNGGIVLGEPDEVIHLEVLRNFREGSIWPIFSGKGWYYNFPLFLYLGWPLSYLFGVSFLPFRVISVFCSLALAIGIFHWVGWKFNYSVKGKQAKLIGFLGALFWSLSPFAVFYSRLGLIEVMVTSLMFLAFFVFDYSLSQKKLKWSVVSGLLLGAAILTKYTAFIFVLPLVGIWGWRVLSRVVIWVKEGGFTKISGIRFIGVIRIIEDLVDLPSFIPLVIAGLITLVSAFVFYLHDGFLFKMQAGASLGIFTDFWKDIAGGYWEVWAGKTGWWLGWPVLILGLGGFIWYVVGRVRGIKGVKEFDYFALLTIVTVLLITTRKPFNPRYFLPIVPFLCTWAGFGVGELAVLFKRDFFSKALGLLGLLGSLFWLSLSAVFAFRSANHYLIERAGNFIANSQQPTANSYLFSNWWPTFFEQSSGLENATWLAESVKETNEFADSKDRSALVILNQEGGVVLLESLYSKDLFTPEVRKVAQDLVENNLQPTAVISDFQPNFPFYKQSYNEVKVYLIEKGIMFR